MEINYTSKLIVVCCLTCVTYNPLTNNTVMEKLLLKFKSSALITLSATEVII